MSRLAEARVDEPGRGPHRECSDGRARVGMATSSPLVVPAVLSGHRRIVAAAEISLDCFVSHPTPQARAKRAAGRLPFRPEDHNEYEVDAVQVASHDAMSAALRGAVLESFAELGCDVRSHSFRLQRYRGGDYVLPHRDYVAQSIYVLTDSDRDGLIIEGEERLLRTPDRSGTLIVIEPGVWHWVDPVLDPVRYTLGISPPLIPESVRHCG